MKCHRKEKDIVTHVVLELGIGTLFDESIGKAESAAELLVSVGEVHGGEKCQGLVLWLHGWDGKVCRELEDTLALVFGQGREVCGAACDLATCKLNRHGKSVLSSGLNELFGLKHMLDGLSLSLRHETDLFYLRSRRDGIDEHDV